MADTLTPLLIDFLEWLADAPRPYAEVMEAWRTSCPRLTVWEDATDGGYVARKPMAGQTPLIELTIRGKEFLATHPRIRSAQHIRDSAGHRIER
ncbi:hypothetical protein SAMN05444161_1070 [Rhizobiales bacterium GAS191]|jgi:hypothetical protein|nr:hypothetical protein SAMN05519103_00102 [Rhizobiales bacterium GAS113]SEC40303.1 hypothetical protein SAMN05444161_1070 [Rhizobiales bacterium GAS191]